MNYLAHIFLSGENKDVKVGSFLGDWVKGSDYLKYSPDIQTGILLHRSIDSFIDQNPIALKSASRFRPRYSKYAGIIIDILYDHYLANMWIDFSDVPFLKYIGEINNIMLNELHIYPAKLQDFLPQFLSGRWIEKYQTVEGIRYVLDAMSRTTSLPKETEFAISIIEAFYEDFKHEFLEFFDQVIDFVEDKYKIKVITKYKRC
jgi:acyl carrier protein phosphodiesterase